MTDAASLTAKLDALFQPWNRPDAPGLTVGVARNGEVLYRRAFGLASVEHAKALSPTTRMRIASTTKPFCGFATLLLVQDGKLALDAPARTYIPELAGAAGAPTLRQLLHHTSGIRDPMLVQFVLNRGSYGHAPEGSGLEMMCRLEERDFEPGEYVSYSNAGYYLLSRIIERVSGLSFGEFLKQRIFTPLGMGATELLLSDLAIVPNLATLHIAQPGGGFRRGIYPNDECLGSSGIISTVDDMLLWSALLRGPERAVGNAETWQTMLERPRLGAGVEGDYGCGVAREVHRGIEFLHHAGAMMGCQSQLLSVPAHGVDIVVMANRSDAPAPALAMKVLEGLLEAQLQPPKQPPSPDDHAGLLGRWFSRRSRTLLGVDRLKHPALGEVLLLQTYGAPAGVLLDADGALRRRNAGTDTIELRNPPRGAAQPDAVEVHVNGKPERFERVAPTPPTLAELAPALTGRYRYAGWGPEVELALVDGKLMLDYLPRMGRAQWELSPISADVLACGTFHSNPPQPAAPATLVLDRDGGTVRGFWLMSDRSRNAWFGRA